ncbi:MAG: alpha/beta hydrolase [Acidimicrobiales bacterium]
MSPFPPADLPGGRYVDLDDRGTTFYRRVAGPPGAPRVLLLHGWTANSALNWYSSFRPLSERFEVIAIDHRGHGHGIRSPEPFTLEDCADDAAALVSLLGVEPVIAVGYSMGGPIAQLLWRRHRSLVSGLVLCATARNFVGVGAGDRAIRGVVTGLAFAARATPPGLHRRVADRVLVSRYDDSELGQWARREARRNSLRHLIEAGRAISQFSSRDWIGEVDVPTAVVVTEHDLVVPPLRQRKLAEAIPGATVHPFDGGHDACATAPDQFVSALLDALDSVTVRMSANRHAGAPPRPPEPADPTPPPAETSAPRR